jgi:hypothetical protein
LLVEGDPTQDLAPLATPDSGIVLLMQAGRVVRAAPALTPQASA